MTLSGASFFLKFRLSPSHWWTWSEGQVWAVWGTWGKGFPLLGYPAHSLKYFNAEQKLYNKDSNINTTHFRMGGKLSAIFYLLDHFGPRPIVPVATYESSTMRRGCWETPDLFKSLILLPKQKNSSLMCRHRFWYLHCCLWKSHHIPEIPSAMTKGRAL